MFIHAAGEGSSRAAMPVGVLLQSLRVRAMAVARRQRVIHAECPTCHWTHKAVLAYEDSRKRCFLCSHCRHVWDTTETAHEEHALLTRRSTELQEAHALPQKKPFDKVEHAAYKGRLRQYRGHLRDRRRS